MALSLFPQVVRNAVTAGQQGFALPTASSSAVPAGQEGRQTGSGYAGVSSTGGFGGPADGPAKATTIQAPAGSGIATPSTAPKVGTLSPLTAQRNALPATQQAGIPTASGQTLTAPKEPGAGSRTDAERDLAREQTVSTLQPLTTQQKGAQAQLAQNSAAAGLSPEVAAGMQQLALMQGAQDVRTKIADITNSSYGNAVTRLSAEETRRAQQQADAIDALLSQNVGTALWDQTIDAAIQMDPENTYYRTLKDNPQLVQILGDANLAEVKAANGTNAGKVIDAVILTPGDEGQLTSAFGQWRGAQFSGIDNVLEAEAKAYVWEDEANQEDIKEYERLYGVTLDPNSEVDKETATAWSQYRDAVRLKTQGDIQQEILDDLANGGLEMTPENLAKVEGISATIAGMMDGPAKMGGISAEWDGDTTNGPFSIFFTDWAGNDIAGAAPSDPWSTNLDALWKEYARQTGGTGMVSRDEFMDTAMRSGVPVTEGLTGSAATVLREMGYGAKTPDMAPTAMNVQEAVDSIDDLAVWDSAPTWEDMPHFAGSAGGGNAVRLQKAYSTARGAAPGQETPSAWTKAGTLFTGEDGRKYRIAEDDSVVTDVGENTIGVFVKVQDLENNGKVDYIQIGKHSKG